MINPGQISRRIRKYLSTFRKPPRIEITFNYLHDLLTIPDVICSLDCEIRELTPGEVILLRDVWPVQLDRMRKRLQRGDKCFCAFVENKIVHYQWVQTSGWHYLQPAGRWKKIDKEHFVVYHVRTSPIARGNRIDPFVKVHLLKEHKQQGYKCAWIYTSSTNFPSQKSIERAGWKLVNKYCALNTGDWYIPLPVNIQVK